MTLVVPRGAEEQAVRRAAPGAPIVAIAAAAGSRFLPDALELGTLAVVIGLCGSLAGARVGEVVTYARVVGEDGSEAIDADGAEFVRAALPHARSVVAYMADHVVTRAAERAELAERFAADVVDMEGMHVARALRARGIRFAMVRVVSDDSHADLPPIEAAFDPAGVVRPLALASAFARAPLAAVRFLRDVQASLRVLGSVAAALASK